MTGSLARTAAVLLTPLLPLSLGANVEAAPAKPPIEGLVSMGDIRFHRHDGGVPDNSLGEVAARPGIFDGVAINVTWAQLEERPGRITTEVLDAALDAVRNYNRAFPNVAVAVNLRVWPGPNAPEWIKNLGGPPVEILRIFPNQPQQSITIGRFWSDAHRTAWSRLQHELAKKYDADPLIREVTNTSCSSLSDEPFLIAADPVSIANMERAGFSDGALRDCLRNSIGDYSGWRVTNIHFPINPFRRTDSGRAILAPEVTFEIAAAFRKALGSRGVIANYGLRSPPPPWLVSIFEKIKELGPPIAFQAYSPESLAGPSGTDAVRYAVSLGATEIELWDGVAIGGFETIPEDRLRRWSAVLKRKDQGG